MKFLKDANLYEVYLNWRNGTGVFECFCKSTAFVTLKEYPNFPLNELIISKEEEKLFKNIYSIINKFNRKDTIFILDIEGEEAVKMAYLLQNNSLIKPVITFNAVLHPYGLIEGKSFISNLINCGSELKNLSMEGFIFILDKNRYIENSNGTEEDFFNNQYETTEEDMPRVELLQNLNYSQAVYVYKKNIKEDIECYLGYLQDFNLNVIKCEIGEGNNGQK